MRMIYLGHHPDAGLAHDGRMKIEYALNPRFDLANYLYAWKKDHDFDWGPKLSLGHFQLALALIARAGGDDEQAIRLHKKFATEICTKMGLQWKLNDAAMEKLIVVRYGGIIKPRTSRITTAESPVLKKTKRRQQEREAYV